MKALLLAAALAQPQPGFSPPPEKPCLTRAEAADVGVYFMPAIIDGLARKCSPSLPSSAFLAGRHKPLTERLRRERGASWPGAKAAIEKMSGKNVPAFLGDTFLQGVAEKMVTEAALQDVGNKDCGMISDVFGTIAPLPTTNFGHIFALLIEIGTKDKPDPSIRLCERPGA